MHLRNDLFMITCAARTGSTMLVRLLRCHPAVLVHGEVWGDRMASLTGPLGKRCQEDPALHAEVERERFTRPEKALYKYFFHAPGRKAVGFKLKFDELVQPRWHEVRGLLERDRDVKMIFLHRENLLERYVSHQVVMKQTGVTNVKSGEAVPEVRSFRVDLADCLRDLAETRRRTEEFRRAFAGHRSLDLGYEALTRAPQAECDRAFAFLGVDSAPVEVGTEKIVRRPLEELILNYDEVARAVREHGFAAASAAV
jgi:LPS sulfotransferase NodH